MLAIFLASLGLVPLIGTEFFPASDESQFRVFLRAPIGTRVEETEKIVARIEQLIRPEPPAGGARVDRVHGRHPGGPLGDLHGEHRPARRAGPGVPGHARPPDAERRARS